MIFTTFKNKKLTVAFDAQFARELILIPKPRKCKGKTSEIINHPKGPKLNAKETINKNMHVIVQ